MIRARRGGRSLGGGRSRGVSVLFAFFDHGLDILDFDTLHKVFEFGDR